VHQIRPKLVNKQWKLSVVPGISAQRTPLHIGDVGLQTNIMLDAGGARQLRLPRSNYKVHPGDLWPAQQAPDQVNRMALNPGDLRGK
jgi:hypothetical protein